jgi:hypothetical protein
MEGETNRVDSKGYNWQLLPPSLPPSSSSSSSSSLVPPSCFPPSSSSSSVSVSASDLLRLQVHHQFPFNPRRLPDFIFTAKSRMFHSLSAAGVAA